MALVNPKQANILFFLDLHSQVWKKSNKEQENKAVANNPYNKAYPMAYD